MQRTSLAIAATLLLSLFLDAQVAPPHHESNYAHIKHSRAENYSQRYDALRCAMVTIGWEETVLPPMAFNFQTPLPVTIQHFGTGFYASEDGKIVTAAHVIANKSWSDPGTGLIVTLDPPEYWMIENSNNESLRIPREKLAKTPNAWGADLAVINTGQKPPCWLKTGDANSVRPGRHVITLGFPGLAFRSLSIYNGIIVARLKLDLLIGMTIQGRPVKPQNDFLRVQMPISTGLSGAAVVDDDNHAIAVVTLAGASSGILDFLIGVASIQDLTLSQTGQTHTVDWPWAVGELAKSLKEFASPGYGDSVPLSYLRIETLSPIHPGVVRFVHQQQSGRPK